MLNKHRFKMFNSITISVFCLMSALFLVRVVFSIFHSDTSGSISNKIAFYVIDPVPQTEEIKIGEVEPNGQNYSYNIEVSNFKNGKTSEVDMDYTMQVVTTTNIPVTYKLYANNNDTDVIGTREIIQDNNGMYFFKYSPQVGSFVHDVQKTDTYTLVINFPSSYRNAAYQDLIETVSITIDVKQV